MSDTSLADWREHMLAGQSYLKTACKGLKRANVFTNALIHQLTAMAIERLLVGVYHYHRKIPADHTLTGLVDGLDLFCPLPVDMGEGIKALEQYDDMCPLVPTHRNVPDDGAIVAMLALSRRLAEFTEGHTHPNADRMAASQAGLIRG